MTEQIPIRIKRRRKLNLRHRPKPEAVKERDTNSDKKERKPIITSDGLLNEVAAAAKVGRQISTLQNRRHEGKPPHYIRRGRFIFYRESDLDEVWGDS